MKSSHSSITILKNIALFVIVIILAAVMAFQIPDVKGEGHFLFQTKRDFFLTASMLFPVIILSMYLVYLLLKRNFSTSFFCLLFFCSTFWLINLLGFEGENTRILTYTIKQNGDVYSLIRIIGCSDDNGGNKHSCESKLFLRNIKTIKLRYISFIPKGKSMKYRQGLLYFHQEGCCDEPDLITVIDLEGNLIKLCEMVKYEDNFRRSHKDDLMSESDWSKAFQCKTGKGLASYYY